MQKISDVKILSDFIKSSSVNTTPYIIAVDGFGGSGKSTLCRKLQELLPGSMTIHTDDFIKYPHETDVFEHDWHAIEQKVFIPVKKSSVVVVKTYDWNKLEAVPEVEKPVQKYVLIDGISLLDEKYRKYYDLKIWMDCPYDIALARGKNRDKEEQGTDHDKLWDEVWGPGSLRYFKTTHPDKHADILFTPQLS